MSKGHLGKALPSRQWSCNSLAAGGAVVKAAKAELFDDADDDGLDEQIEAARIPNLARQHLL